MATVAIQRPLKGSRISSFYPVKSLPPLSALDSAFQLQEYISLLIRRDVHDVDTIVSIPGSSKSVSGEQEREAVEDTKGEEGEKGDKDVAVDGKSEIAVDEACWIYEQLRRLAQDLSHPLITMLQQECTRQSCPEMKAGEWLYLCVAHGNEGAMEQCCAIDYILHTLDSATALLNSPRAFPSRLSIPPTSHRHFSSLARRLGRIFAHAYFHHRDAFAQAEAESALYARFLALTARFDLVPPEFLVIPPSITGREKEAEPPRLLAAALDPLREREREREEYFGTSGDAREAQDEFQRGMGLFDGVNTNRREPSPRKVGRSRTDTMVYSEAASVMEELGRAETETQESQMDEGKDPLPEVETGDVKPQDLEPESQIELLGQDLGAAPGVFLDPPPVLLPTQHHSEEQAAPTESESNDIPLATKESTVIGVDLASATSEQLDASPAVAAFENAPRPAAEGDFNESVPDVNKDSMSTSSPEERTAEEESSSTVRHTAPDLDAQTFAEDVVAEPEASAARDEGSEDTQCDAPEIIARSDHSSPPELTAVEDFVGEAGGNVHVDHFHSNLDASEMVPLPILTSPDVETEGGVESQELEDASTVEAAGEIKS
ncbi:hypothetical protein AcW1_001641 [Taiwanofungus camphoratus]|nr:hypothetical protein AcV7_001498 [Antrodia cinnamomea]KAI0945408.1 hypothetical protein AcW1_001641 [Antrodia cinnamomea]